MCDDKSNNKRSEEGKERGEDENERMKEKQLHLLASGPLFVIFIERRKGAVGKGE